MIKLIKVWKFHCVYAVNNKIIYSKSLNYSLLIFLNDKKITKPVILGFNNRYIILSTFELKMFVKITVFIYFLDFYECLSELIFVILISTSTF